MLNTEYISSSHSLNLVSVFCPAGYHIHKVLSTFYKTAIIFEIHKLVYFSACGRSYYSYIILVECHSLGFFYFLTTALFNEIYTNHGIMCIFLLMKEQVQILFDTNKLTGCDEGTTNMYALRARFDSQLQ